MLESKPADHGHVVVDGGLDTELEDQLLVVGKSSVLVNYGFLDDWTSLQSALTGAAWLFVLDAAVSHQRGGPGPSRPPKAAEAFAFVHHGLAATGDSAAELGWKELLRVRGVVRVVLCGTKRPLPEDGVRPPGEVV